MKAGVGYLYVLFLKNQYYKLYRLLVQAFIFPITNHFYKMVKTSYIIFTCGLLLVLFGFSLDIDFNDAS